MNEIEKAKATLREAGYFVENLWHVDDVQSRYECDNETALEILDRALTNEATMEQIRFAIEYAIEVKREVEL